ncbi:MAG: cellobiose transporter [Caulobacteraceae bacterium]|nr:cellobiose transporter [Caulobacteraceae bacterium]
MTASLIVTADDFGADVAVNEAVEIAHREGVLTAASLMVGAPAAADAVARARALPSLAVGLHLALVEARPVLPPEQVSRLVDGRGLFRNDMAAAGATMFFNPAAGRQLAAEIAAQFEAFAATGLRLDHVNAHKHFHLHPTIAGLILKIGARHGLRAARVPFEPDAVLRAVEPETPPTLFSPMNVMARVLRARFRGAGLVTPDQVFGLRWSGAMTTLRLAGLIARLPQGLTEIYLHPAVRNNYPGSAPGYRYAEELAALVAPEVAVRLARSNVPRGGFLDFAS